MQERGEAVADAGGMPPFGGDRPLFSMASPDPERPFAHDMLSNGRDMAELAETPETSIWNKITSLLRKPKETARALKNTELSTLSDLRKVKPIWSNVQVREVNMAAETMDFRSMMAVYCMSLKYECSN